MNYNDLKLSWINGNKKDVVYEIKHNYGFYDFATDIESDTELSSDDKVDILCSVMRLAF